MKKLIKMVILNVIILAVIIIIIQHLLWNGNLNVVDMEIIENQIQQMFGQL